MRQIIEGAVMNDVATNEFGVSSVDFKAQSMRIEVYTITPEQMALMTWRNIFRGMWLKLRNKKEGE